MLVMLCPELPERVVTAERLIIDRHAPFIEIPDGRVGADHDVNRTGKGRSPYKEHYCGENPAYDKNATFGLFSGVRRDFMQPVQLLLRKLPSLAKLCTLRFH